MKPNPLPLLHKHCGLKIRELPDVVRDLDSFRIHKMFQEAMIEERYHNALRGRSLLEWGRHKDPEARRALWQCYFPETRPHVFHILVYRLNKSPAELSSECRLSAQQIRDDLARPRILQTHLQNIARYAMELHEVMASPNTKDGVDPRYMELYRALKDPKRIQPYGTQQD